MSASTMIIQPESPSSHFIDDIEPDYDYALEDLDIEEMFWNAELAGIS